MSARTYAAARGSLVWNVLTPRLWRYFAFGRAAGERHCVVSTPKGKLVACEPWSPAHGGASACFHSGTFLHMLFGLHSREDLRRLDADCYACHGEAAALLRTLFPKQPSSVWPVA